MRAASRQTTHPMPASHPSLSARADHPTRRRRTRPEPSVPYADVPRLARHVATLLRYRWPGLEPGDYIWRTVARYCRERDAGPRPSNLPVWVRSTVYELVVDDQRADRGVDHHHHELNVLLRELALRAPKRLGPVLLSSAVAHLHPRDVIITRLVLLGHRRDEIAARLDSSAAEIDQAYARSRARLRAVIAADPELRQALRRVAREPDQVLPLRPESRKPPRSSDIDLLTRLAETAAGVA